MIKDKKRTICIENIENKTVTVLVSRKNKNVICHKGITKIRNFRDKDRFFCCINNCKELDIEFIPTNLKKNRIYVEPKYSHKLRDILSKKFRRVNN